MAVTADGRRVRVRRNGFCSVSLEDDLRDSPFVIDFAHARELAEALEQARPLSISSRGRVFRFTGSVLDGQGTNLYAPGEGNRAHADAQRSAFLAPWEFDERQRLQLAVEIRQAVNG